MAIEKQKNWVSLLSTQHACSALSGRGVSFPNCLWEQSVPRLESDFVFSPVLTYNSLFPDLVSLRVYISTVQVIIILWKNGLIWLLFTKHHCSYNGRMVATVAQRLQQV